MRLSMADVVSSHHEDDGLGDVGGVIGDTFEILGHANDAKARFDLVRLHRHEIDHFRNHRRAEVVDITIAIQDARGLLVVARYESVESEVQHVERRERHRVEIGSNEQLCRAVVHPGALADVHRLVPYAFEIGNEPERRCQETQIVGDGLAQRDDAQDERMNLELVAIDLNVEHLDVVSDFPITLKKSFECDLNDSFATSAHCHEVSS